MDVLESPREAGTPGAATARARLRLELELLGYTVTEQPFTFSPAPLRALPLFGAGLGWLTLLLLPLLVFPDVPGWGALAAWLAGLGAVTALAAGVALGWNGLGLPLRSDANLIATRPGAVVRRWIVAHLDTKAQGHSMAGRLVAVWVTVAAVLVLTGLAVLRLAGAVPVFAAAAGALLALAAGALAGRGRLRGASEGGRDNGSGVVAALTAAAVVRDPSTGVLITGAEEFGLVGARVFARLTPERLAGAEVVNVDTVDEEGLIYLVSHDDAGHGLAEMLAAPLAALGPEVRRRRLPLGIFVDSHPLSRGGAAAVTVARLTWATLRRLHTPRDTAGDLTFATAERLGRIVGALPPAPEN